MFRKTWNKLRGYLLEKYGDAGLKVEGRLGNTRFSGVRCGRFPPSQPWVAAEKATGIMFPFWGIFLAENKEACLLADQQRRGSDKNNDGQSCAYV